MKSTVVIGLAALTLLAACNKSGGNDQANNGGGGGGGGGDASAQAGGGPGGPGGGGDEKMTLAQFQQRQVDRIMRYDTNHDGKVTKDEFVAAMKERIAERQAQNGGDDSGAPAPDPQAIADRMFARMDTNGQGFITKDEVEKSSAAQFAQIDTDHKGYVTRDEMRARFAARGGGGPPGGGGGQGGGDNGGGGGGN